MEITNRDTSAAHIALLSLWFAVLIRTAWISENSWNTLRCVVNFVNGYGPTLRTGERLQGFVHPLWFLLVSGGSLISGNVFAATFVLSIVLSLVTMWLVISCLSVSFWSGMLAGSGLLLSKAYVDFSTSGFENPLAHFLLVLGVWLGFVAVDSNEDRGYATAALAVLAALYLCRPDLVLIVLPFWMLVVWRSRRDFLKTGAMILVAILPAVLWTLFSLFYYPTPLPNRAYMISQSGLTGSESFRQGLVYLVDSFSRDPITLTFVLVGIVLAWRGSPALKALAIGVAVYLGYVVSIGGDMMTGRFLSVPLIVSAAILARSELSLPESASVAVLFAVLGAISLPATILSGRTYSDPSTSPQRIRDERGLMFWNRGLLTATRDSLSVPNEWNPNQTAVTGANAPRR